MGKRGVKPRQQVSTKWSPQLAYAVGLIATDGYLSKDKRHIDFTSEDIELIELFTKCLGLNHLKIGFKVGSTGKKCPRVQFGDVNFYQWLEGIGIGNKKSLTIGRVKVPKNYFFDFLRGCFDGDGTIYAYWDPRWRSSYMFYIAFASGSLTFLVWLQETIYQHAGIEGKIKRSRQWYQLAFAKKASRRLFQKMFHSKEIPYLKRKFLKAQKIFDIDAAHNLELVK